MPQDRIFTLKDFNFNLPEHLIAQHPAEKRDESRLLILFRETGRCEHTLFKNISEYLISGDLLVLNNARVIPARIYLERQSGGAVEIVLTRRLSNCRWLVLCNRTKRLRQGEVLTSAALPDVKIKIISRVDDSLLIETDRELDEDILKKIGEMPLPPYIARKATEHDSERYQTVYAEKGTAAASPTAGLHFTDDLINLLKAKGVDFVSVTLDVSWGTFQPVRDNDLSKHKMHREYFSLPADSAEKINSAREDGRRVLAVGTTSLRTLEATLRGRRNVPHAGETDIFIYPPKKICSIDALITNFHTPYSTLLMLVSAFAGYENIMNAYKTAVEMKYRFFSYGDAMLIV